MRHALIIGSVGAGRTTLINRLVEALGRPVSGYITQKEEALFDEALGSPIYLYVPGQERRQTANNLMGYCKKHRFATIEGAFNRQAAGLLEPVEQDHLIVLDEIGFMETREKAFCDAILARLDGDIPVIAAVKDAHSPFLDAVRTHSRCRCFFLNEQNRESCFQDVFCFIREQLDG